MASKDEGINNEVVKRPVGRPTRYTEEFGIEICNSIAEGASLRGLDKIFPRLNRQSIQAWLTNYPEFSSRYKKAQQLRTEYRFDMLLDIAMDGGKDNKVNVDGKIVQVPEVIARSRLSVDTLKWVVSKENPAKYGDKVSLEGNINHNHEHKLITNGDMQDVLQRAGVKTIEQD